MSVKCAYNLFANESLCGCILYKVSFSSVHNLTVCVCDLRCAIDNFNGCVHSIKIIWNGFWPANHLSAWSLPFACASRHAHTPTYKRAIISLRPSLFLANIYWYVCFVHIGQCTLHFSRSKTTIIIIIIAVITFSLHSCRPRTVEAMRERRINVLKITYG